MKKIIIIAVAILVFSFVFPFIWNAGIVPLNPKLLPINIADYELAAPALASSLLTVLVIYQSYVQQKENKETQKQMQKAEISAQIGYLIPYYKLKESCKEAYDRQLYPHDLREKISLYNTGNADLFVISTYAVINGREVSRSATNPLFISNKSPHRVYNYLTSFIEDELELPQLDISVELTLKNVRGYQYKEKLFMGFEKVSIDTWNLNKLNLVIEEASDNAD